MTETSGDKGAAVLLYDAYIAEMRLHATTLIWLAYRRLVATDFVASEEDDITGELVRELRIVLQDATSPGWVIHYEVREQVPQNVLGKKGKRRPKIDIEVERHQRGMRPCLGFEAKRLGRDKPIGAYLGNEGLCAFLTGYYPAIYGEAGMLGYIQEKDISDWSTKLHQELSQNPGKHRLEKGCELRRVEAEPMMPAFHSRHTDTNGKALLVIHILLPFVR
jgi:hypothetical protein